jgi:DNA-binding transcriptional LysR family regulator
MNAIDLAAVDLNLLKAFEALERARNATRAGELLGIGQPAVSHALSRLRELFKDDLFVRGPQGLDPTPVAASLIEPIRAALATIDTLLRGNDDFNPLLAHDPIRLGLSDIGMTILLPGLLTHMREAAPTMSVQVRSVNGRTVSAALDHEEVDLVAGMFPVTSKWHRSELLYHEDFVCVYNPRLVDAGPAMTLERYAMQQHIKLEPRDELQDVVDEILTANGVRRRVRVVSPYFLSAVHLLFDQPFMATLPRRLAERCCMIHRLEMSELPFEMPELPVSLIWHARYDTDRRHQWLRQMVRDHTASLLRERRGEATPHTTNASD